MSLHREDEVIRGDLGHLHIGQCDAGEAISRRHIRVINAQAKRRISDDEVRKLRGRGREGQLFSARICVEIEDETCASIGARTFVPSVLI